jgi:hypothetical protein
MFWRKIFFFFLSIHSSISNISIIYAQFTNNNTTMITCVCMHIHVHLPILECFILDDEEINNVSQLIL